MRLAGFPQTLPDELLPYSACARYIARLKLKGRHVVDELFGSNTDIGPPGFMLNIYNWYSRIPDPDQTLGDIVGSHTVLPYFTPFMTDYEWYVVTGAVSGRDPNKVVAANVRQELLAFDNRFDNLRYCSDCIDKDLDQGGESYWRRTHQVPTLTFCPAHPSVGLKFVRIPSFRDRFELMTPDMARRTRRSSRVDLHEWKALSDEEIDAVRWLLSRPYRGDGVHTVLKRMAGSVNVKLDAALLGWEDTGLFAPHIAEEWLDRPRAFIRVALALGPDSLAELVRGQLPHLCEHGFDWIGEAHKANSLRFQARFVSPDGHIPTTIRSTVFSNKQMVPIEWKFCWPPPESPTAPDEAFEKERSIFPLSYRMVWSENPGTKGRYIDDT